MILYLLSKDYKKGHQKVCSLPISIHSPKLEFTILMCTKTAQKIDKLFQVQKNIQNMML